ncbi:hypothetical protein KVR01_008933 [Diaporthe batatas]|uniref:uncharacterized protein n=1 Tax=Diaporthe batatas TaxID=748121 RepID=UPI001D040513|nr:uncharacterized protein KVR01_008933 [Diaporthe batatas]KAG8160669.1 hypothetical protein KVR01_008933 [Diaporthe batatas]
MSQCVSCNNQPNDNDSLGGGTHEGAVTPMVVGIIAGTVAVFVLVLCALFYCAKLENDKARRSLKAAEADDHLAVETVGPGGAGFGFPTPPQQQQKQQQQQQQDKQPSPAPPPPPEELGAAKLGLGERRPSSVTVVAGEADDSRCGTTGAGANSSWIPARVVGGRKKALFGWGGGKKSHGRDNPPVTAIEMV